MSQAKAAEPTAYSLFLQIPPSVFDNTYYPMSEEEKEKLLEKGYTSDWVLTRKTPGTLHFVSLSEDTNKVTIHVFFAPYGGIVALGAETPDACSVELWRFEQDGGLIPYAVEAEEPEVSEYFLRDPGFSHEITTTYQLCLYKKSIEAKPLFWDESGLVDVKPDRRVLYNWNGTAFTKTIHDQKGRLKEGKDAS